MITHHSVHGSTAEAQVDPKSSRPQQANRNNYTRHELQKQ